MEIGFVGLGRMGANMTTRLLRHGHRVVVHDRRPDVVVRLADAGAIGAADVADLVARVTPPRVLWLMVPAGKPVDDLLDELLPRLGEGDVVVDGGNSRYRDSVRRAERLAERRVDFVDCGTSGGIWGLDNGYCLMLGGRAEAVRRLAPLLDALAPPDGWRHVGPSGAGHYAKMVHNGIEYGLMQAYAEGFELLQASDYRFDLQELAELWNRGSVVRSWLLELAGRAFTDDPQLARIKGYVEDSGEGRWMVEEALDRAVPAEVLTLALLARFRSRQPDSFRDRVIAALRREFGGHPVRDS